MTYATATDVETELGRPASSDEEFDQWEAWLARVERAIVRRFARAGLVLDDQVTDDDPTADDVKDVEVAAVIRKITNPLGLTSVTRTVDDGTVTTRREGMSDVPGLAVTAEEWESLLPSYDAQAWSTRPGFEPDTVDLDVSWT
jgi:hypothetical protein